MNNANMTDIAFSRHLATLLANPNPAAAAQSLAGEEATGSLDWLAALPPVHGQGNSLRPMLPPLAAFGIFAGTVALLRLGKAVRAWPFMKRACEFYADHWFGRSDLRWGTPVAETLQLYPDLHVAAVDALIAAERWSEAALALNGFGAAVGSEARPTFAAPTLADLVGAALTGGWLGPLWFAEEWVLARRRAVIASGALDERRTYAWKLYADHLLAALHRGAVDEALALLEAKADTARGVCDAAHETGNYHFTTLCVLARAGCTAEAVAAARELVRRGYWGLWRLGRDGVEKRPWVEASDQREWLASLEGEPPYQAFRAHYIDPPYDVSGAIVPGPFLSLHRGTLGGKARKRCKVSGRLVEPGDPVVRFRLYHGLQPDEPHVAAEAAFDDSAMAPWRDKHAADRYAMADFVRVRRRLSAHRFEHPDLARFVFDTAEGAIFDPDAFLDLVAAPSVQPMRFTWLAQDHGIAEPPDGPNCNDAQAGEFVNLTVLALRCGHGPALFARLAARPRAQADPVMAMLATIGRADCRAASARHFGLPDLPALVDTAFAARPTLDDMLRLADYGRDQPRFGAALAGALARYNLHLYSNTHPQADWRMQELEHYANAKCCQLLFLFARCPAHVPVLATMLERRHLVDGVRLRDFDGYENASAFFWRTAVMNRMLHAPEELPRWLEEPWMMPHLRGATLRDAKRHVAIYAKRTGGRS